MFVMAQIGGIFALLVFLHFVADWIFQSHDEAMAKTTDHMIRAKHCIIYAAICTFAIIFAVHVTWQIAFLTFAILWLSHFFEDTYLPIYLWAKYVRRAPQFRRHAYFDQQKLELDRFKDFASESLGKILLIVLDQLVHILFLVPIAWMIVVPTKWAIATCISVVLILGLQVACLVGKRLLTPKDEELASKKK